MFIQGCLIFFLKKLENTYLLAEEGPLSSHLAFRGRNVKVEFHMVGVGRH